MEEKEVTFYEKYDQLFEKPKLKGVDDRKRKILILGGIISIALAAVIPYVSTIIVIRSSERIIAKSQKRLDELKASDEFTEVPILKQNMTVKYPPNYKTVKPYNLKFDGHILNFGNGYQLEIKGFSSIENDIDKYSVKPAENYDTINTLLQGEGERLSFQITNDGKTHFYDKNNPYEISTFVSLRASGNLLDSLYFSKMKEKGSFLSLFQQQDIGEMKTGVVVNASPSHGVSDELGNIKQTNLSFTKYWLFPDGVGLIANISSVYLDDFSKIDDFNQLNGEKMKKLDELTNGDYSWLLSHFEMTQVAQ